MNNHDLMANVGKLTIWQRLLLVMVLMGAVVPVVVWQYGKTHTREIATLQREAAGAKYIQALRQFNEQVTKHRGLTNSALHGNKDLREQLALIEKSIGTNLQAVLETDSQIMDGTTFGVLLETADKVANLRKDWESLKVKTQSQASAQELFAGHNALLASSMTLLTQVSDRSGLSTDSDLASNYLARIAVEAMPEAIDSTEKVRSLMNGAALSKTLSSDDQNQLIQEGVKANAGLNRVESFFSKAVAANSGTSGDIVSQQQQLASNALRDCRAFLKKLEGFNVVNASAEQSLSEGSRCLDRLFFVYDASTNSLVELLNRRATSAKDERNTFLLLVCITFAAFCAGAVFLARQINSTFLELAAQKSINSLARANEVFQPVTTAEETTVPSPVSAPAIPAPVQVTETVTVKSEANENLIQEKIAGIRSSMESMVSDLRAVVSGDLTACAQSNDDATDDLADGLNALIVRMRMLVSCVNEVSTMVTRVAETTGKQTEHLVNRVQDQSQQILNTSAAVEEMTSAVREVSQAATVSGGLAQKSLYTARQGTAVLEDNVRGMNRIREQVVEASNQIRQLSEAAREITSVLQVMDEIADQSSLLALNASIQAASAGDSGRGFSVVAQHIEGLSERAAEANQRISRISQSILLGAEKALSAMEENTREVIESAGLAWQANEVMSEFEGLVSQLSDLIGNISVASRKQVAGSESLEAVVGRIIRVMEETTAGVKQSAATVGELRSLADDLRNSVVSYKLPAQASSAAR